MPSAIVNQLLNEDNTPVDYGQIEHLLEQKQGIGSWALDKGLGALKTVGNFVDSFGPAQIRGLAGGQNLNELVEATFNPEKRISGSELLGYGRNQFTWGGLGLELVMDPFVLLAPLKATGKGIASTAIRGLEPVAKAYKLMGETDKFLEVTKRIEALKPVAEATGARRALLSFNPIFTNINVPLVAPKILDTGIDALRGSKVAQGVKTLTKPYFASKFDNVVNQIIYEKQSGYKRLAEAKIFEHTKWYDDQLTELSARLNMPAADLDNAVITASEVEQGIINLSAQLKTELDELGYASLPEFMKDFAQAKSQKQLGVFKGTNARSVFKRGERLAEWEKKYAAIPDPVKEFVRVYQGSINEDYLAAIAEGVRFAPRTGVIGYLRRQVTAEGAEVLKDAKVASLVEKKFGIRLGEIGIQKARNPTTENKLLEDINSYIRKITGRPDLTYFSTDPTAIANSYKRHLYQARTRSTILQSMVETSMVERKFLSGANKKMYYVPLHKALFKGSKPLVTRFGKASWAPDATIKEVAKVLKDAGYGGMAVSKQMLNDYGQIMDAVFKGPEALSPLMQTYNKVVNFYRGALTFTPAFLARNLWGGVMLNHMSVGANPNDYIEAFHDLREFFKYHDGLSKINSVTPSLDTRMMKISDKGKALKTLAQELGSFKSADDFVRNSSQFADLRTWLNQNKTPEEYNVALNLIGAAFDVMHPTAKAEFLKILQVKRMPGNFAEASFSQTPFKWLISLFDPKGKYTNEQTFMHEFWHGLFRNVVDEDTREQILDTFIDEIWGVKGLRDEKLRARWSYTNKLGAYTKTTREQTHWSMLGSIYHNSRSPLSPSQFFKEHFKKYFGQTDPSKMNPDYVIYRTLRARLGEEMFVDAGAWKQIHRGIANLEGISKAEKQKLLLWSKILQDMGEANSFSSFNTFARDTLKKLREGAPTFKDNPKIDWYFGMATPWNSPKQLDGKIKLMEDLYANNVVGFGGKTAESQELLDSLYPQKGTSIGKKTKDFFYNPASVVGANPRWMPIGFQGNQNMENVVRLAHYKAAIRKGMSHDEAIQSVKKYLFDYSQLSDFEKKYMRSSFLFYTYTRKMVPLMLQAAVDHPRFLTTYARVTGQIGPEKDRPSYYPGAFHLARYNGKELIATFGLPFDDIARFSPEGQGLGRVMQKVANELTPPLRVPLEGLTGTDFFTGRPQQGSLIERAVEESPFSRWSNAIESIGDKPTTGMLALLTGVNVKEINIQDEQRRQATQALNNRFRSLWRSGESRKSETFGYQYQDGQPMENAEIRALNSLRRKLGAEQK